MLILIYTDYANAVFQWKNHPVKVTRRNEIFLKDAHKGAKWKKIALHTVTLDSDVYPILAKFII